MDAWNNVTVTNITVMKSTVGLTINPVAAEQLHEPSVTVEGTINRVGYTVWVNGVKAADNGDGTWTAENVPLPPGGTAVVQARAIPNSDYGGNGTGGGGPVSYENSGNPNSAEAQDTSTEPEKLEGVYVARNSESIASIWHKILVNETESLDELVRTTNSHSWDANSGGSGVLQLIKTTEYCEYGVCDSWGCEGKTVFTWPSSLSEWGTQVTTVTGIGDCDEGFTPGQGPTPPLSICRQHCVVAPTRDETWTGTWGIETLHEELKKTAQTTLKLRTGGKGVPGRMNLWVLTGHALEVLNEWEAWPCGQYVPKQIIPYQQVTLGELGKLGSDGRLYKALPDGVTPDVTPTVKGVDYYTFGVNEQKYELRILANDVELDPDKANVEFCVGQKVTFRAEWSPTDPPSIADTEHAWLMSPKFVNEQWQHSYQDPLGGEVFYGSVNYRLNQALLAQETTSAWWVSGGEKNVRINPTVDFDNGQSAKVMARGKFDMYRPLCRLGGVKPVDFFVTDLTVDVNLQEKCYLQIGTLEYNYDIDFDVEVSSRFIGDAAITQICTLNYSNPNGRVTGALDQIEFYRERVVYPAVEWNPMNLDDGPGAWDYSPNRVQGSFTDYVRFRPRAGVPDDNIYVTLGIVQNGHGASWDILGVAQEGSGTWTITTNIINPPTSVDSSDAFPNWTEVFQPE